MLAETDVENNLHFVNLIEISASRLDHRNTIVLITYFVYVHCTNYIYIVCKYMNQTGCYYKTPEHTTQICHQLFSTRPLNDPHLLFSAEYA